MFMIIFLCVHAPTPTRINLEMLFAWLKNANRFLCHRIEMGYASAARRIEISL